MLKSSNLNSVIDQLDADRTVSGAAVVPENNNKLVKTDDNECSMAALQMSFGVLEIAEPPLVRVRAQLKELIGKQNKFYIDVSKEKYKLDCSEVAKLIDMRYKERLVKIKKDMQSIYQRSKVLKKRAANVATCKQRDYQRKLEKQQQEESLIGGQLQ